MTDFAKFPNAAPAAWSSGPTTFAVSRLRVLFFDGAGGFAGEVIPAELDRTYAAGPTMRCGPAASSATCGRTGSGSAAF